DWRSDVCSSDLVPLRRMRTSPSQPTLLLLHGLEGSDSSVYMQGMAVLAAEAGWNVVMLNQRSCGGVMNQACRLYHGGSTDDLDTLVKHLVEVEKPPALYLAGFSMGGNMLARWLGQNSDNAPVAGASIISPPFDLARSAVALDAALRGFYSQRLRRQLLAKSEEKIRQYPGV